MSRFGIGAHADLTPPPVLADVSLYSSYKPPTHPRAAFAKTQTAIIVFQFSHRDIVDLLEPGVALRPSPLQQHRSSPPRRRSDKTVNHEVEGCGAGTERGTEKGKMDTHQGEVGPRHLDMTRWVTVACAMYADTSLVYDPSGPRSIPQSRAKVCHSPELRSAI